MQVKIVIGTVAFMLSMIILGFAALREPARLEEYTAAFQGRQIEQGAKLFQSNCATCHGKSGRAEECENAAGEPIGCQGVPLNNQALVCGDTSERMEAMGWEGSKDAFIRATVSAGRMGTVMPAWSEKFGGPMRDDQVGDVVAFVLNWESEELCSQSAEPAYDWPASVDDFLAEFPEPDPVNGEELFNVTYGCNACHGNVEEEGSNQVGPWLGEIADVGATRIDGTGATQYVYDSILYPSDYITEECPTGPCTGPPSTMPATFAGRMGDNPQDMADVLSYLLGEQLGE